MPISKNNNNRSFFKSGFTGFWHGLFKNPAKPGTVISDVRTGSVSGSFRIASVNADLITANLQATIKILVERT